MHCQLQKLFAMNARQLMPARSCRFDGLANEDLPVQ